MDEETSEDGNEEFPWHLGVFDAHCHPTDTMSSIPEIHDMKASAFIIMATRAQDQTLVAEIGDKMAINSNDFKDSPNLKKKIVPSFGWHPWFSYQLFDDTVDEAQSRKTLDKEEKVQHYRNVLVPRSEDSDFLSALPDPRPLSDFLAETKSHLEGFPLAMVGEVGLDRAFRLPESWMPANADLRDHSLTPGGREGRSLSPYRVHMDHQRKVLTAQLKLAGQLQRAVSCHGVQAHGAVHDTIRDTWKGYEKLRLSRKKRKLKSQASSSDSDGTKHVSPSDVNPCPFPPRLCLHSFSGPPDLLKQYLHSSVPTDIYFSFSIVINFSSSSSSKTEEVIKLVPDDRILVESDMHIAGARMDENLAAITRKVCELKKWDLSGGVQQLASNWKDFVFGKLSS